MDPRQEIRQQIEGIATSEFGWRGALAEEMRIQTDLGLDSLRAMALIVEIENRFEIVLEPEDEARLETIGDLIDLVIERRPTLG